MSIPQPFDRTARWLRQHHGDAVLRLADAGAIPWALLARTELPAEAMLARCRDEIVRPAPETEQPNLLAVAWVLARLRYDEMQLRSFFGWRKIVIESPFFEDVINDRDLMLRSPITQELLNDRDFVARSPAVQEMLSDKDAMLKVPAVQEMLSDRARQTLFDHPARRHPGEAQRDPGRGGAPQARPGHGHVRGS